VSWALHRIDDRLIHGQVVVAWGHRFHPRRIWVVDDAAAADPLEREVFEGAAEGVRVSVVTVAEAAAAYASESAAAGAAFLLVRDLAAALRLVDAGAAVPTFNVGGLHYAPGKRKVNEYVYLDDADRAAARGLLARGVALEVQDVPASRPMPLESLDPAVRPE
jgi:mannose/fructose/N-acetylgalactosamine-specific phosphotransferase system component IIB